MLQAANHASRVRHGATSELADASCEMSVQVRELAGSETGALMLLFTAHDTCIPISLCYKWGISQSPSSTSVREMDLEDPE